MPVLLFFFYKLKCLWRHIIYFYLLFELIAYSLVPKPILL